jgi:hypothetical protein
MKMNATPTLIIVDKISFIFARQSEMKNVTKKE